MRKVLTYFSHSHDDEFIRSEELSGLNFSLIDIADALDNLVKDDNIAQKGRRFIASIVDLVSKDGERYYAVFRDDVGMSPGGGFELEDSADCTPSVGMVLDISDREDNIVFEAEFLEDGGIAAVDQILIEARYAQSLADYLRKIAEALTQK